MMLYAKSQPYCHICKESEGQVQSTWYCPSTVVGPVCTGAPELAAPGAGLLPPTALARPTLGQSWTQHEQQLPVQRPGPSFRPADLYRHPQAGSHSTVPYSRYYPQRQQYQAYAQSRIPRPDEPYAYRQQQPAQVQSRSAVPVQARADWGVHHQGHRMRQGQPSHAQKALAARLSCVP